MSEHGSHQGDVKAKALGTLRQLAAVATENGELARWVGMAGQGWIEDELARLWRALAAAVESGLDVIEVAARTERDPWTMKPSVLTFWGNLSPKQESGDACLICGGDLGVAFPGEPSAVINGRQTSVHADPNVCTDLMAKKLAKEVPF